MTTTQRRTNSISKVLSDALVDQLRSCQSKEEILDFERWFNAQSKKGPLYEVICELLRNRSISRGLAAKWLETLFCDRENKLKI